MPVLPARARRIFWTAFATVLIGHALPVLAQETAGATAPIVQRSALSMIGEVAKSPPYIFFVLVACSILTVTLIIDPR